MNEEKAKRQLRKMLAVFTPGSVLHLLGEIFHEQADAARLAGDSTAADQCRHAQAALLVVGLGIDAIRPR